MDVIQRRPLLLTPLGGLIIAGLAIAFSEITDHPVSDVLFSGQEQVGGLVTHASAYSVGALLALLAFKGLAYSVSLAGFRGGPDLPGDLPRRRRRPRRGPSARDSRRPRRSRWGSAPRRPRR